jgi:hypothetical protein
VFSGAADGTMAGVRVARMSGEALGGMGDGVRTTTGVAVAFLKIQNQGLGVAV